MQISRQEVEKVSAALTAPGAPFELEERLIGGQTFKAFKKAPQSLVALLNAGRSHRLKEYLIYEAQRLTYEQTFARADALAAILQKKFGVKKGDRVAIAMRNSPDWIVSFIAAAFVGAIVAPINSWGKTDDLSYCIADSGAKCVILDPPRYRLIAEHPLKDSLEIIVNGVDALPPLPRLHRLDDLFALGQGQTLEPVEVSPGDPCLILYTSGSTGTPKGVTHRNVGVVQALMTQLFNGARAAVLDAQTPRDGATQDVSLVSVPLFHASGFMSSILVPQLVGSKLVMMYKWDAARALALVEKEKVTSFPTVPAIMKDFLSHPDFDRYDTSSLKRVAGGGSATPQGLAELITEKLGPVSRSMGYGMTETLTAGFGMSGRLYDWKPYSGGMKAPTVDARVVDPAGRVLSRGEEGEIQLFGICNMVEYWNKPYATRAAFTTDGYLKTGDAGIIDDDDYIHITGRLKELVIRGGEKISPPEIEQVAYTIGKIQEAVVFGVDDADMGEELALVCLLSRGCTLSAAELREYLSQRLPHFKVPKHIAFSAEPLPRNASEKLHKLATKERYLAGKYVS